MAKWKVITQNGKRDSDGSIEMVEEVITCDSVNIDQSGKYMVFGRKLDLELVGVPPNAPGMQKMIKIINTEYIVEAYDINECSHTMSMLTN